jgi:hypothetical protein
MITDTDLAELAAAMLRDGADRQARAMLDPTNRPRRRQCDGCWKFRPLRPWTQGRRRELCGRCWRKALNAITVRTWTRSGVRVATKHPEHGELHRGTITPVRQAEGWRMGWRIADQDSYDLGELVGDYVEAEARLLAATSWADEIETKDNEEG